MRQCLSLAMPICGSPTVKQFCNVSIHVCKRVCRLSRPRSFGTRSLVMSTAQYALVRDTTPIPCSSPADVWLKAAPRGAPGPRRFMQADACVLNSLCTLQHAGAYTTARTFEQDKVFELTAHINRLASSCQQMLQHDSQVSLSRIQASCLNIV